MNLNLIIEESVLTSAKYSVTENAISPLSNTASGNTSYWPCWQAILRLQFYIQCIKKYVDKNAQFQKMLNLEKKV